METSAVFCVLFCFGLVLEGLKPATLNPPVLKATAVSKRGPQTGLPQ